MPWYLGESNAAKLNAPANSMIALSNPKHQHHNIKRQTPTGFVWSTDDEAAAPDAENVDELASEVVVAHHKHRVAPRI